jgi:hypothetical protein
MSDGQVATLNHASIEAAACFTRKAHSNQALDALALSGVRSTFLVRISSYARDSARTRKGISSERLSASGSDKGDNRF